MENEGINWDDLDAQVDAMAERAMRRRIRANALRALDQCLADPDLPPGARARLALEVAKLTGALAPVAADAAHREESAVDRALAELAERVRARG